MNPFKVGDEVVRKPNTDTSAWREFHRAFPRRVYTVIGVFKNSIVLGHRGESPLYYDNFDFAHPPKTLEEML